jgi:membrane associated rhomboid family serine protease
MNALTLEQDLAEHETSLLKRFTPILGLVAFCWLVWLANALFWRGALNHYGVIPRSTGGLFGIVCAPFLHASARHLAANTLPLLFLGGILCARSRSEFFAVASIGTVLTGALTWLFARNACHIGASGLIFCFFGYLASLACFRRTFGTLLLSVVCILAYGGMVKGILPTSTPVSWESHLAGLVSGILLAWASCQLNPPASKQPPSLP